MKKIEELEKELEEKFEDFKVAYKPFKQVREEMELEPIKDKTSK